MTAIHHSPAWHALEIHQTQLQHLHMRTLFAEDTQRFAKFNLRYKDLLLDYSKHRITAETMPLLLDLARSAHIEEWRAAMFRGDKINCTEQRAVLHTALRNRGTQAVYVDGQDVMPAVRRVLEQMRTFCARVRDGTWRGFTDKPICDIVNIGIGGSDLGPAMVCAALAPYAHPRLRTHFVSNVDGAHLASTLAKCHADTTLFIVASKTFTTQETMTNAHSARAWFLEHAQAESHIAKHFVALSTNQAAVKAFGISPENQFEFWDWVGGRYSLWSTIGLSIALSIGMQNFEALLEGGYDMDTHFINADLAENIPVIMALLGVWYSNFWGMNTHSILPYDQGLSRFPAYLQQADMESNGKFVTRTGQRVAYSTGSVIWGEAGTNGQHAFYQLIHQGTQIVPCDFIMPIHSHYPLQHNGISHHNILLANFLAQTSALMLGKTAEAVRSELNQQGLSDEALEQRLPHCVFEGNRPSSAILIDKITPHTLGMLIALYEHKIFVQGIIWNINSYDQWGVEYGKQITQKILPQLTNGDTVNDYDCSTNNLIAYIKSRR